MPDRNSKRQIVINAAANTGLMVVKVVVVFFVSPILVHGLGDTRYGVWMFVDSIIAYMMLGNFGVDQAVMRFVAKYDGLGDRDHINRVVNTSIAALACVGGAILAVAFCTAWFWESPFGVGVEMADEARWLFLLLGVSLAVGLPMGVPFAMLAGLGRFPARSAVAMTSLLVRSGLLVAVAVSGGGLVTIGVVLLANRVMEVGLSLLVARHCFPQLAFSPRYVDRQTLRTIGAYGAQVFLGSVAYMVVGQTAPLVIGAFMSPESLTFFSIGSSLPGYAVYILAAMVLVITPAVSKWEATGNLAMIRSLFIKVTRYSLYVAVPVGLGLLILGRPFLGLWMGPQYADACYTTIAICSISLPLSVASLVAGRTLDGIGKVRPMAILLILRAILTIGLSVALVRPYGIEGVAWGVSIALAVCALGGTIVACRYLELSFAALVRRASWGPLLASAVAALVWIMGQQYLPVDSWLAFFSIGALGMVPYALVMLLLEPDIRGMARGLARRTASALSPVWRVPAGWLGLFRG
jgi:O-antigen/teichoic acid export membrane protein